MKKVKNLKVARKKLSQTERVIHLISEHDLPRVSAKLASLLKYAFMLWRLCSRRNCCTKWSRFCTCKTQSTGWLALTLSQHLSIFDRKSQFTVLFFQLPRSILLEKEYTKYPWICFLNIKNIWQDEATKIMSSKKNFHFNWNWISSLLVVSTFSIFHRMSGCDQDNYWQKLAVNNLEATKQQQEI